MTPEAAIRSAALTPIQAKLARGVPITMLTCYDYPTARLEDAAGIDVIFVGDSVGTNVLGYTSEREVTMDDMLHHLRAVRRGVERAFVLVDFPHGSYATPELALVNARRFRAAGADGVKLEGGSEQAEVITALVADDFVVCGHIGYTPQTLAQPGRRPAVQGRRAPDAIALLESVLALEAAGMAMVVVELVPAALAGLITERLRIPTIGIGSGNGCDGQVLVVNDVLGITPFRLKLAKRYQEFGALAQDALVAYRDEVEARAFPAASHAAEMDPAELAAVEAWLDTR